MVSIGTEAAQLIKAISRPLGKWWRQSGWLWLSPVVITITLKALVDYFVYEKLLAQLSVDQRLLELTTALYHNLNVNSWQSLADLCEHLSHICLVIACLASASVANGLITRYLAQQPLPQLNRYYLARYVVLLAAVAPAVITAVVLWLSADWLIHESDLKPAWALDYATQLVSIRVLLPAMLWVLALLALQPDRPWLAWLWGLAQCGKQAIAGIYASISVITSGNTFWHCCRPSFEERLPEVGWSWELGALCVIAMLIAFGKQSYWPAYMLLALCIISPLADAADTLLLYPPKAVQLAGSFEQPLMLATAALHGPNEFVGNFIATGDIGWMLEEQRFSVALQQPVQAKLWVYRAWRHVHVLINLLYVTAVLLFIQYALLPVALPRRL